MKKSELKELVKNQDECIVALNDALVIQHETTQKYKGFIKDLEYQLSLAAELSDQKDLEIQTLNKSLSDSDIKANSLELDNRAIKAQYEFYKKFYDSLHGGKVDEAFSLLEQKLKLCTKLVEEKDLEIKKLHSAIVSQKVSIPFVEEAKNKLSEAEKDAAEPSTNFSSRFMPNVKFRVNQFVKNILKDISSYRSMNYISTDNHGALHYGCFDKHIYDEWLEKEVSIYEAIPELVPDGMVYDKESDSLVKKP